MADRIRRPVLQFLYGADLHPERLTACCPSAQVLGVGELKGYRLAFFGHNDLWDGGEETVQADEASSVFGLIVAMSPREADFFDKVRGVRLNGTGSHFHFPAKVATAEGDLDVVLYKLDDSREAAEPSGEYLAYMAAGARHFSLPLRFVAEIEALACHASGFPVPLIAFPAIAIAAGGGCAC